MTDVYAIVGLNGDVNKARLRVLTQPQGRRASGASSAIKEEARGAARAGAAWPPRSNLRDPPIIEGLGDCFPIMVRVIGPGPRRASTQEAERIARILREHSRHRRRPRGGQPAQARAADRTSTARAPTTWT